MGASMQSLTVAALARVRENVGLERIQPGSSLNGYKQEDTDELIERGTR